jgi:hypothetical protein
VRVDHQRGRVEIRSLEQADLAAVAADRYGSPSMAGYAAQKPVGPPRGWPNGRLSAGRSAAGGGTVSGMLVLGQIT